MRKTHVLGDGKLYFVKIENTAIYKDMHAAYLFYPSRYVRYFLSGISCIGISKDNLYFLIPEL